VLNICCSWRSRDLRRCSSITAAETQWCWTGCSSNWCGWPRRDFWEKSDEGSHRNSHSYR